MTWFVDATHVWATSTAFTPSPLPEVQTFVDANPVERDRGEVWDPLHAAATTLV